jgi:hypothetical protein
MRMQAFCNERQMAGACGIGVLHTPWLANTWVQSGVAFCDGGKLRGQPQLAMQHLSAGLAARDQLPQARAFEMRIRNDLKEQRAGCLEIRIQDIASLDKAGFESARLNLQMPNVRSKAAGQSDHAKGQI